MIHNPTKIALAVIIGWLSASCQSTSAFAFTSDQDEPEQLFSYQLDSGKCLDASGKEGLNLLNVDRSLPANDRPDTKNGSLSRGIVIENKNFECTDLTNLDFTLYVGGTSYPTLKDWNFRGALLRNTGFAFVTVVNGDFRGARVESIVSGYTTISGIVDQFSKIPSNWRVNGNKVSFYQ